VRSTWLLWTNQVQRLRIIKPEPTAMPVHSDAACKTEATLAQALQHGCSDYFARGVRYLGLPFIRKFERLISGRTLRRQWTE
jgi:hypothetical protein